MKLAKWTGALFAAAGSVILIFTTVLCLISLDAEPKILKRPEGAAECARNLVQAILAGDDAGAEGLIYGQPSLGLQGEPEGELEALVWEAFRESLSISLQGEIYLSDSDWRQDLTVTCLDLSTVTASLSQRMGTILTQWMEEAEELSQIYDEQNQIRQELVDQAMSQALEQVLAEEAQTVTKEASLTLIYREDRWWAVPDQAFLEALKGNLA